MQTIKGKRAVEIEVAIYKFEASSGDFHKSLTIVDGEIQEVGCWDSRGGGDCRKGQSGFADSCYSTIRFIVDHKPEELKNIYNVLEDGLMKDFCRKLQQEKLAELNF